MENKNVFTNEHMILKIIFNDVCIATSKKNDVQIYFFPPIANLKCTPLLPFSNPTHRKPRTQI